MDTKTRQQVDEGLALIKRAMPETYKAIQERAQVQPGAYGLVRKGLAGVPNVFYACERGHVVGTPFAVTGAVALMAGQMVQFGFSFLCFWAGAEEEAVS